MSEQEVKEFLNFAQWELGAKWQDCDESKHLYHNDEYIGGWAGDVGRYFICSGDYVAKLVRMMDVWDGRL